MSEQMRSEFEAWYEITYGISLEREFRSNHFIGYVNEKANHRWAAWQASRAALCVQLPPSLDMPGEDEFDGYEEFEAMEAITCTANGMRHACRNAIHAAGVKTK